MNCPYCETKMLYGFIRSRRIPKFYEKSKNKGKILSIFYRKGIPILETYPSYYCENCKKIIITEINSLYNL